MEIHLAILDGVDGALRDAVLRQPQAVRAAPDRHLPRAADRARQVDLPVELDPRHGRVLRPDAVPRRVLGDDGRPRQPARAHRQHQAGAGHGGARVRRATACSSSPTARRRRTRWSMQALLRARRHRASSTATATSRTTTAWCWPAPSRYYVEAFPMTAYSMYGARAAALDQEGAARPEGRGQARPRRGSSTLTNCTFDGHMYNTRRVMEECLAIKPDLIFLWDEAWFGFARFSPFLPAADRHGRRGRPRGVASPTPRTASAYAAPRRRRWRATSIPRTRELLDTRLLPDPATRSRLRVYQTQLDPQVDVGAAPGLDGPGARRGLPPRRGAVQGGGVHPRLDLAEPADHRLARRRAAADGARGLRARRSARSSSRSTSAGRSTATR